MNHVKLYEEPEIDDQGRLIPKINAKKSSRINEDDPDNEQEMDEDDDVDI